MLIVGAGGHAREVYDVMHEKHNVNVFEEFETTACFKWGEKIHFIRSYNEVEILFKDSPDFILGVGNPALRERLFERLIAINGIPQSIISETSWISKSNVHLGNGLNVMAFVFISNNVKIGDGTLLNAGCKIHHDCTIGKFCEISPNVVVTGNCMIGDNCSIGASATILPNLTIGNNVTIGAGSVVTKNIKDNQIVMGVPARSKKAN